METQEIIDSLSKLIKQADILQDESGPKSNDFIKWVREVKQFIEKAFGSECPQLRSFKKIDYYPKQFDILSSESAFKKAWIDGLHQAKDILQGLLEDTEGKKNPKPPEIKVDEPPKQKEKDASPLPEKQEKAEKAKEEEDEADEKEVEIEMVEKDEYNEIEEIDAKDDDDDIVEVIKPSREKNKNKQEVSEKIKASTGQKILLVDINNESLNEDIFKFIKRMGYEPVVIDQNIDGDDFLTDSLEKSVNYNTIYAIIMWKGDMDCEGKRRPRPSVLFATGYFVAKLTNRKVLIIHESDIDPYDEYYGGLNFLAVDNIQELMELKLAREMDAAGLNIDFNFLKKKK